MSHFAGDFGLGGFDIFRIVFFGLIQLGVALDVERLAELRTIAIERVGLEPQLPAEPVALLDLFDAGLVGQVDRLGDGAADERLRSRHHPDVPFDGDEAMAVLAALVGAIEDRQVRVFEVRSASTVPRPQMTSLA